MKTVKERLLIYLKSKGYSQRRFERECQLPNGYINNIRQSITPEKMQKIILHFPNINPGWLLTGEGESERNTGFTDTKGHGKPYYPTNITKLNEVDDIKPSYNIDFEQFNTADLWVNFIGNSMEPLISNGDIIALKHLQHWRDFIVFGEVYVIETSEFNIARTITASTDCDKFKLIPSNIEDEYCEQEIDKSIIKNVYAVKGVVKQLI